MQHTEIYDLNLIQPDDAFSPDPLNENTQLLEGALTAESTYRQSADESLSQRIASFEAHHVRFGTYYSAENRVLDINLGFHPKYVFVHASNGSNSGLLVRDGSYRRDAYITTTGFHIQGFVNNDNVLNAFKVTYLYLAFD